MNSTGLAIVIFVVVFIVVVLIGFWRSYDEASKKSYMSSDWVLISFGLASAIALGIWGLGLAIGF